MIQKYIPSGAPAPQGATVQGRPKKPKARLDGTLVEPCIPCEEKKRQQRQSP